MEFLAWQPDQEEQVTVVYDNGYKKEIVAQKELTVQIPKSKNIFFSPGH